MLADVSPNPLSLNPGSAPAWDSIQDVNPNHQWDKWKDMFVSVVDKHAPLKRSRIRNKRSPWLSSDIISLIRKRDFLKKRAIDTKEADNWNKYKRARNTVNNEIKIRKSNYNKEACFAHKKEPSKLWSTINEVCSRKPKSIPMQKFGNR